MMIWGIVNERGSLDVLRTERIPKSVVKLIGKSIAFGPGITMRVGTQIVAYVRYKDKNISIVDWMYNLTS